MRRLYKICRDGKNNINKDMEEKLMEIKKKKNPNASLYITLVVILVILAAVVGSVSVASRRTNDTAGDALDADASKFLMDEENRPALSIPDTVKPSDSGTPADSSSDAQNEPNDSAAAKDTEEDKKDADSAAESVPDSAADAAAKDSPESLPRFASPVSGGVIGAYSDTVPVFSQTMNDYRTHAGVDLASEEGGAVKACADGVIGAVYEDPLMGTCMTVVHSGGAVSTYKGLYSTLPDGIAPGVSVACGQVIAASGDSALIEVAEEPHVHFELSVDGVTVDPCQYIDFSASETYEG